MDMYDIAFCTCNTPSFNLHTPFRLHILNKVLKFLILCVEIKAKLQHKISTYIYFHNGEEIRKLHVYTATAI